ncbi:MAG: M81 family metallopeptidase [Trueperaceae bacterium]
MPKILIAECKQEVSTFNPVLSHLEDFQLAAGAALLAAHEGVRSEVAGALETFCRSADGSGVVEVVPALSARAITSGGVLAASDFERLASMFLAEIERHRDDGLDGVLFCLHGAMAAQNEEDPEGYLLTESRRILGERIPIVVSLDLHGVLTDRMLEQADAVVPYHTYPHVDFFETGERAAALLLAVVRGEAHPVTARVPVPALVRGDELITETGLLGHFIHDAQRIERDERGLSAGMFIGNPFTDVPELGSSSVVVTDGDEKLAQSEALALATGFWEVRKRLQAPLVSLAEMVEMTKSATGTVILTDAADATSSGASGDSNAVLRALHEAGYGGRLLAPIVDPAAAEAAFTAGVDAEVKVSVGGALDPARFRPLPIVARVRSFSDGEFESESHGGTWQAGPTAVLEWGNVTLIVTSRPVSLYDRSLFLAHDQDPRSFDAVVVKSPHCQPHFFAAWAQRVINVDAPGSTSANLPSLGHERCRRPMFPLEPGARFEPQARIFRRSRSGPGATEKVSP